MDEVPFAIMIACFFAAGGILMLVMPSQLEQPEPQPAHVNHTYEWKPNGGFPPGTHGTCYPSYPGRPNPDEPNYTTPRCLIDD